MFAELLGHTSVGQLLTCDVVGRMVDPDEERLIDDIMTAMSSADPRLWPFKLTRLGAAHGSAALGVAITLIASQGAIFGAKRFRDIAEALVDLRQRAEHGLGDDELEAILRQGTVGFGILYGKHDARFDALVNQLAKRTIRSDAHMQIAMRAVAVARGRMNLEPHVFVAIAAVCLDLGMTPFQIGTFGMLPLFHDALANAAEGAEQQPALLRCIDLHQVQYDGREPRSSPRAHASL